MPTQAKVARTFPLVSSFGGRLGSMELAADEFFEALRQLSVEDLKALHPTGKYVPVVECMIAMRELMR